MILSDTCCGDERKLTIDDASKSSDVIKFLEISRSGYCAYKKRKVDRQRKAEIYAAEIAKIFKEGNGTYGADRVCGELRENGYKASFKRVKVIMEQLGLKSIDCRRRQRCLTDSRKAFSADYVNLVKDMELLEPFQVISSDISYISTGEGFEYVSQIRDIVSGIVLLHMMSDLMKAELVVDAIKRLYDATDYQQTAYFIATEAVSTRARL